MYRPGVNLEGHGKSLKDSGEGRCGEEMACQIYKVARAGMECRLLPKLRFEIRLPRKVKKREKGTEKRTGLQLFIVGGFLIFF